MIRIIALVALMTVSAHAQSLYIGTKADSNVEHFKGAPPYIGEYAGPVFESNWTVNKSIVNGVESISGTIYFKNIQSTQERFRVLLDLPVARLDGFAYGGTVVITLVTDQDGGTLTCGGANYAVGPTVNGMALPGALGYCPFNVGASGAGNLSVSAITGLPLGSLTSTKTLNSGGLVADLKLTGGDSVSLTFNVKYKAD